ncbi:MAG TPA: hypothetical protein VHF89_05965 [Solirubrobacteraceae bacterium]|nr:hypothetical protein [Solirubrobacteraceae bacterium]
MTFTPPEARTTRRHGIGPAALVAVVAALVLAAPAAARPLVTGLTDPSEPAFAEGDLDGAYAAAKAAGIRLIRVPAVWGSVAPRYPAEARDPAHPRYQWAALDARLRRIFDAGLEPLLSVYSAPGWARIRGPSPDPTAFGNFMAAAALRYSGTYQGLPRVRYWQLWNEPNILNYLDQGDSAVHYRAMVNAAYPEIHAVHADNVVVAGGTAPFAGENGRYGTAPLPFIREALAAPMSFDAWSHHPYTSGPPVLHARNEGDASIGDLPKIRRILRDTGHGSAALWATEFSWDSAPPDPYGVPLREHARWVAEGLYRMWRHGVSTVVWFQLRDNPKGTFTWGQTFQSGLYFQNRRPYAEEKAKPALRALRFPFVALPVGRRVSLWGRTPDSSRHTVVVERRSGRRWRRVIRLRADRDGIFRGRIPRRGRAPLRARAAGDASLPFAPRRTRRRHVNPFGGENPP